MKLYSHLVQPRSSNPYEAAEPWLAPPEPKKLLCGICKSLCMEPASCIRKGDAGTDAIRDQIRFLETQHPNFDESDHQKVYSEIARLWQDAFHLEDESRTIRKACCSPQTFICPPCLLEHLRNEPHRHERCPMCRSILACTH